MLNYQKLHYDHYYVMNEIGETTACSRAECFAPETYLPQCPYRQRWFYDPEAGYAVRLPRNQKGNELGLRNQADLKREERYASRRAGQTSIDQPYSGEDGDSDHGMDFIDKTACVEQIVSDMDTLNRLVDILNQLPIADQELLRLLVAKTPKAKVASHFKITVDGVRYRELQLRKKLRNHPDFKNL